MDCVYDAYANTIPVWYIYFYEYAHTGTHPDSNSYDDVIPYAYCYSYPHSL
jgi:hypothetical protein